jgi:glycosyltransferase involved in cell wall biosynthesis
MDAILRILRDLGCRITFWPDDLARTEPYVSDLQQRGIEVVYGPLAAEKFISRRVPSFHVAVLCRAFVAARYLELLRASSPGLRIIFDTVDLHHLREGRRAAVEGDPSGARQAELTKALELGVVEASDLVWVTSTYEADTLKRDAPGTRVAVVPNIHQVRREVPPYRNRRDILFIGGFQHQPNEDAVVYFAREIMPLVRARLPGVRLVVVGSHVTEPVRALAGEDVEVCGFVPDVEPVFDAVRLSVAPLRYGAGVKGKISQSLAMGVPVVTTPIGAEGMGLQHGQHAMIASDPETFAQAVVEVYTSEATWSRLSAAGRELLAGAMSHEAVRETVKVSLGA